MATNLCAFLLLVAASGDPALAPLVLKLPKPAFAGTPKNIPPGTTVQKPTGKPREMPLVPKGAVNVALKKKVTASDEEPVIGDLSQAVDGDKEAGDGSYLELGPGTQWVQLDLGQAFQIHALALWHYHGDSRVCRDVVIQSSDDADFIENVRTLFNNDGDNSSGLGLGKDHEYFEHSDGLVLGVKDIKTRYLRFYSKGSTADDMNRFTEVEVYATTVP
jgi:hypothetical protein